MVYHLIMLKLTTLLALLLLTGCAVGSTTDPADLREPTPEAQRPAPAPVEDAGSLDAGHVTCVLIRTHWGGNCKLDEYRCDDGSYRLDGRCYPPAWEVPWKNLPDPPSRP